jgi:hypothetical protein
MNVDNESKSAETMNTRLLEIHNVPSDLVNLPPPTSQWLYVQINP